MKLSTVLSVRNQVQRKKYIGVLEYDQYERGIFLNRASNDKNLLENSLQKSIVLCELS